ncbi:hypothetical protein CCR75_003653 [Bremia lactucae]|uniref:HTH CENPB-type domain-containing protein n=1 Tax=Bremia lactucae TaxID=4779 RepID=A0A976ILF4_BRELC|nr:hypothetical protein CCR75_003653 [Bremia lactucae]
MGGKGDMATPSPLIQDGTIPSAKSRRQSNGNGNLTNYQRKVICEFYRKSGGVMSQKDLAQWTKHEFGLKKTPAQSTISGILRRQHEFINMSTLELGIKKRRVVQHPQLDSALANWVIQMAGRGQTVQGDLTKEKAKEFAHMLGIPENEQPEFSNGWLHSFQLRHNFSFRKFNAEQHHPPSSFNDPRRLGAKVLYWTTMDALMAETDTYDLKDVFAVDETPVLYTMPPPLVFPMLNPITARLLTTFKKRFRRYYLRYAIDKAESMKHAMFDVDVLQAMKWANASWDEISAETIQRAWIPTQLVRDRVTLDEDNNGLLHEEEEGLLDSELNHLILFLRLSNPVPMMEYLNDESMSEYPVHEDKFDVVSNVCEVPEDDVEESSEDNGSGRTLSLQEKLKAFRDVLHVLKDRSDADDTALNAIRRVQDAIRMEGQKEALGTTLHASSDVKNVFDLDPSVNTEGPSGSETAHTLSSLDDVTQQHMDAALLLDSSESALSAASASLAEGAGDHTSVMLTETVENDRHHVHDSAYAVI